MKAACTAAGVQYRLALEAAKSVGFPLFMKPEAGAGMSAGVAARLMSGRIDNMQQLEAQAKRLWDGEDPETEAEWDRHQRWAGTAKSKGNRALIMERFLSGPEIFAETVAMNGKLVVVSFRASKVPRRASDPMHLASEWHWPAMLSAADHGRCRATVEAAVGALGLQNGVFGLQLVLDPSLGCVFLEAPGHARGIDVTVTCQ